MTVDNTACIDMRLSCYARIVWLFYDASYIIILCIQYNMKYIAIRLTLFIIYVKLIVCDIILLLLFILFVCIISLWSLFVLVFDKCILISHKNTFANTRRVKWLHYFCDCLNINSLEKLSTIFVKICHVPELLKDIGVMSIFGEEIVCRIMV